MRRKALRGAGAAALAALALLSTLAPLAEARAVVGIGDQKPEMFTDPRFLWLKVGYTRMNVGWDVRHSKWERPWVDGWMRAAHKAKVRPVITFGHSWTDSRRRILPSVATYRREIRAFRKRFPWVREYIPWNEANHCSQPTCNKPERAAAYYRVLRQECRRCTVVAADVLDQRNLAGWIRRFRRAARPYRPRLWGLHNYLDANRLRSTGTDNMLRAVPGQVWLTETGGLVRRNHYRNQISFPESPENAARATQWVLDLARERPRIRRVYFYHWNANSPTQGWDSAFIDPFGTPRPAFDVLARARGRNPKKAPIVFSLPPQVTPPSEQPPPEQGPSPPPPAEPQQQPPPPQDPPPPPPQCVLGVLCR